MEITRGNVLTVLLGSRVQYRVPICEMTPEQAAAMLDAVKGLSGKVRDEEGAKAHPTVPARIVSVYLGRSDIRPTYTLLLDEGRLVDATSSQFEVSRILVAIKDEAEA